MKGFSRVLGLLTASAMLVTSVPVDGLSVTAKAAGVDATVVIDPAGASTFNDTDHDGFGEFQGWGTSLCWWANRLGYSKKMTEEAARAFFSADGLNMNIGRYNVGGGDNVTEDMESATPSEFLHAAHIRRSDSEVPGYCVDVTKITKDMTDADLAKFDRYDKTCGFAWNYNWDADKNQMNILVAAMKASGEDFIGEAFSNSPPYFMTNSGCSSGATDSNKDNLRADSYDAFATYMADVIMH